MRRKSYSGMNCSVAEALDVVGDPWTLLIVRDALWGYRHFGEFQERLGIPRTTLTTRLAKLVDDGVLDKTAYQQNPERFDYTLTDKGRALQPIIVALLTWGDAWSGVGEPPVRLVDNETGETIDPILVDAQSGRPLSEISVRAVGKPPNAVHQAEGQPMSEQDSESSLSGDPVQQASATVQISAPITLVWDLVTSVANLAAYSPECTATEWSTGASVPSVGARFRGTNERGDHRWQTECTITDLQPSTRFAFAVDLAEDGSFFSQWIYELSEDDGTTRVSESVEVSPANMANLPPGRAEVLKQMMSETLATLKTEAEEVVG